MGVVTELVVHSPKAVLYLHTIQFTIFIILFCPKGTPLKSCQNVAKRTTFSNFFVEKVGILLPRCLEIRTLVTVSFQTNQRDSRDLLGATLVQTSRTGFSTPWFMATRYAFWVY